MSICSSKQGYSCRYTWMIPRAGKKQNMAPMWNKLMNDVDHDEPTSFLDHVYLGCTQRECKPTEIIIEENRKMFQRRISAGAKMTKVEETSRKDGCVVLRHGRTMLKSALRDIANWQTRRHSSDAKSQVPCLDDHHFKKEELESVGDLSKACPQIVLKTCT